MKELTTENKLPKRLFDKAVKSGKEFGWRKSDFIEVVETAKQFGLAIVGGQVQYILSDGTCELYWLSYDSEQKKQNENWEEYCNRTANECIDKFENIISKTDIEKDAINSFEFLKTKKQNGIQLENYLFFILYFDDTETPNYLSYSELEELVDDENTDYKIKTCAGFLLNALNDYPKFNLQEPAELVCELRKEIDTDLNYDNLQRFYKSLNPNIDGWKMEALSSMFEMFDFERKCNFDKETKKETKLETIILNLTNYYKQIRNTE